MVIVRREVDYALRALAYLASSGGQCAHSIGRIAVATGVSESFLRKIAQALVDARLVISVRGRAGGLRLARAPERIALLEVMRALDLVPVVNRCLVDAHSCNRGRRCAIRSQLGKVQAQLYRVLRARTLADCLNERGRMRLKSKGGQV